MITNLAASVVVSLVTNTAEIFPRHIVPDAPPSSGSGSVHAVFYGREEPVPNPKEKWVKTSIVEITTVKFQLQGRQYESKSEQPVTNWTTHFILAPPPPQQWVKSQYNAPVPPIWPIR